MKKIIFALTLATAACAPLCAVKPVTIVQLEEEGGTKRIIDFSNLSEIPAIKIGTTIKVVIKGADGNEQTVKGRVLYVF